MGTSLARVFWSVLARDKPVMRGRSRRSESSMAPTPMLSNREFDHSIVWWGVRLLHHAPSFPSVGRRWQLRALALVLQTARPDVVETHKRFVLSPRRPALFGVWESGAVFMCRVLHWVAGCCSAGSERARVGQPRSREMPDRTDILEAFVWDRTV